MDAKTLECMRQRRKDRERVLGKNLNLAFKMLGLGEQGRPKFLRTQLMKAACLYDWNVATADLVFWLEWELVEEDIEDKVQHKAACNLCIKIKDGFVSEQYSQRNCNESKCSIYEEKERTLVSSKNLKTWNKVVGILISSAIIKRAPTEILQNQTFIKVCDRLNSISCSGFVPLTTRRRSRVQLKGDVEALELTAASTMPEAVTILTRFKRDPLINRKASRHKDNSKEEYDSTRRRALVVSNHGKIPLQPGNLFGRSDSETYQTQTQDISI